MSPTSVDTLWERIRESLRGRVPAASFDTWFDHARPRGFDEKRLELGVPNRFIKDGLTTQGGVDLLAEIIREDTGWSPEIQLFVDGKLLRRRRREIDAAMAEADNPAEPDPAATTPPPPAPPAVSVASVVRGVPAPATHPAYSFDTFVCGKGEEYPLAFARLAVKKPGEYPVVYFCGDTGTGKTHLLHAIVAAAHHERPGKRILLTDARRFVQEYTAAHLARELDRFRRRYDDVDLLAMDDFHILAEGQKTATAAEFLALFDRFAQGGGRQIVLAGARAPAQLPGLSEHLRDRLSAALPVRLVFPDDGDGVEAAVRLVRVKAKLRGVAVGREAARVLAEGIAANARALEGAVGRLCALAEIDGGGVTVATARLALRDMARPERPAERVLGLDDVARAVAGALRVRLEDLRGRGRTRGMRLARQLAAVLARRLTAASLAEMGQYLDGRTHATVLSLIRSAKPGWWRDDRLLARAADEALRALGRRETLEGLFPEQGILFADLAGGDEKGEAEGGSVD